MKAVVTLFILLTGQVHLSGQSLDQGYDITVKIENIKDSVVYLGYNFGDQKFVKDTSRVHDGNVLHFRGDEPLTGGIYFIYSPNVYFEIIVNEPSFTIETDTSDYIGNMKVEGSRENQLFNRFQRYMAEKQKKSRELSEKIQGLDPQAESEQISALRGQMAAISQDIKDFQNNLIAENEGTLVSKLVAAMQKPEVPETIAGGEESDNRSKRFFYYKKHFFDNFDLSDPELLRTPLYQPRVDEYMDKLTHQHPDSISKAADYLLSLADGNDETFRYLLVKLTNKYETSNIMGMERVFVYLAENYYLKGKAFWADSALVAKFDKRVKELKPNLVGNQAPDMILRDTMMRPVRLSNLDNRFIVLYFYDPDCGHCKKTTPKLREIYTRLKGKGVEVWAACTVTDVEKWKKYINEYNLDWINVADPYYQSNFRADYDIKSTPILYVLDKDKEIIAKRLGVEQIEDFINRIIEYEDNKS